MPNPSAKRATSGLMSLISAILLTLGLSLPAFSQSQPQVDLSGKNVLVLHAFESNVPIFELTDRGLRATLDAGGVGIRNQFFEYLDLARNPSPGYRKYLAELMRLRYGQRKLDIIITLYPEALEFLLKDCAKIFPDVPIIALYLPPGFEPQSTGRRIIPQTVRQDMIGTLESALKLVPGGKRVYVVAGAHEVDRKYEAEARRSFKKWEEQLEFRYLSDVSLQEILEAVSTAPPGTIVLLMGFTADVTGKNYTTREVGERLSRVSKAPVFGLLQVLLGHGIAGGRLVSFEYIGTKAGELTVDILRGTRAPDNIPAILDVPAVPMFDWRQLRRWNLSEAALPKGSIVINRKLTFWDFRNYIIGGMAFVLLETFLIIFLVIQRRRKKVADEELAMAKQHLDAHLDNSPLAVVEFDPQFRVIRWSREAERLFGWTAPEVMGRAIGELRWVYEDDVESVRQVSADMLSGARPRNLSVNRNYRKDGSVVHCEWYSSAIYDAQGRMTSVLSRVLDITERKGAEEALRESEGRLRDIMFSMADWVWEVDENGVYTYSSQKGSDLLERSSEEIIGKTPFDFMPPDEAKRVAAIFSQIAANKAPIRDLENWNVRKNGQSICFLTNGVPILDEEGNLKGYRGVDKDITESKRAEAEIARTRTELLRVERLLRLNEMTASLAHELNQPLAAILSNAQAGLRFLGSGKIDLDEFREILQDIIQDDQRAGNVIRSLRSMVKREEVERTLVILNDVLSDVVQIFHTESVFRNVHVETELDRSLPPILGDKVQLQQVVLNLILNAADAMSDNPPEQRKIILRTGVKEDRVRVTVRDFGPGIDKENLERIFESFFTTKGAGLGMGLAVCRTIVEAHGARIWAENDPDRGATVVFEIPIKSTE